MKALNLYGINDLRYDDVPKPSRKQDEVLLKIRACGICGSDIPRVFSKGTYHFPTIIGHEFAGEIVDAEDSTLVGRRAAVFPLLPCGKCDACEAGHYAQCHGYSYYGSRENGGMSEFLAVKERNLCVFSDDIPYEWAAMSEPAAVALHAFKKTGLSIGDTLMIYGIGAISLLIAQWAKAAGVKTVILVGRTDGKVDFARNMGYEAVNIRTTKLSDFIVAQTNGAGVDAAVEATGSSEGVECCMRISRNFAKIVLMGNPIGEVKLTQDGYWQILRKELQIAGTWNSSFSAVENDWLKSIAGMESGILDLSPIITHQFSLEQYKEAFDLMREKREMYLKVMFIMGE